MSILHTSVVASRSRAAALSCVVGAPTILAVAHLDRNQIGLYNEEGEPYIPGKECPISNTVGKPAAQLAWNPKQQVLAIAWCGGGIALWSDDSRKLKEDRTVHRETHKEEVTVMRWSDDGERLVTGDVKGKVVVWEVTSKQEPRVLQVYEEGGSRIDLIRVGDVAQSPVDIIATAGDPEGAQPSLLFFYSAQWPDGTCTLVVCNDAGNRVGLLRHESRILRVSFRPGAGHICLVDATGRLTRWKPEAAGWTPVSPIRLPGAPADTNARFITAWAGEDLVVSTSTAQTSVRMYNVATHDNFVLPMPHLGAPGGSGDPPFTCLDYLPRARAVAAATKSGHVLVWARRPAAAAAGRDGKGGKKGAAVKGPAGAAPQQEHAWELLNVHLVKTAGQEIKALDFGAGVELMAAVTASGVHVLREERAQCRLRDGVVAVQTDATHVVIDAVDGGYAMSVDVGMAVQGVDVTQQHLLVWSKKAAIIYQLTGQGPQLIGQLPSNSTSMTLNRDTLYRVGDHRVEACALDGTVRQTLAFDEPHGPPSVLSVGGESKQAMLAVVTRLGYLSMWRVGGREAREELKPPRRLVHDGARLGPCVSVRMNCKGTLASLLVRSAETGHPEPRLYVYDVEVDHVQCFDFGAKGRMPVSHTWDLHEDKLVACETVPWSAGQSGPVGAEGDAAEHVGDTEVATLFVSADAGIVLQDAMKIEQNSLLVGVAAPKLHLHAKSAPPPRGSPTRGPAGQSADGSEANGTGKLVRTSSSMANAPRGAPTSECRMVVQLLRDFQALQNIDEETARTLIKFSYCVATGAMDAAYREAKKIHDASVWESMAYMCIRNRRLEMAEHCLGNMGHAQGSRALRESAVIGDTDARVAVVAMHLGLLVDAENLLESSKQYKQLADLLQASNQWPRALEVAGAHDAVHLRDTWFHYARACERHGKIEDAIVAYERAGVHADQVPRMLHDRGLETRLAQYCEGSKDVAVTRWWAHLCESRGDLVRAIAAYEAAGDHLSIVKLRCMQGDLDGAEAEVNNAMDAAAAFQLAVQYEGMSHDDPALVGNAIKYFVKAGKPAYAVRLARKYEMDQELFQLALDAPRPDMLDAAAYFEERGDLDRAVTLFQAGGAQGKALDLCFKLGRYDALERIANELDTSADPGLLRRCAHFLQERQQPGKAARFMAMARDYEGALAVLEAADDAGVPVDMTEELADAMTPAKDDVAAAAREAILRRVAKVCKGQGLFHVACKKYTQAGDRKRGMKALLMSADVEKIMFFASVSRDRDVYRMAANFLQTQDWRNNATITKNIIAFYTKAKDMRALASFYESCAQIEIDEYRDYAKALTAMRDALRCLQRAQGGDGGGPPTMRGDDLGVSIVSLQDRASMVERYLRARATLSSDAGPDNGAPGSRTSVDDAERICLGLINEAPDEVSPDEASIRVGDVFALLIEHKYRQGDIGQSYALIERMKERGLILTPYMDADLVEEIHGAVGAAAQSQDFSASGGYDSGVVDDSDVDNISPQPAAAPRAGSNAFSRYDSGFGQTGGGDDDGSVVEEEGDEVMDEEDEVPLEEGRGWGGPAVARSPSPVAMGGTSSRRMMTGSLAGGDVDEESVSEMDESVDDA
ncbi:unnamed protein product [Pedinophyceae sp. YPF-701]|nr:unnamed protein product [Pedinophyceae sp. YPF-701]